MRPSPRSDASEGPDGWTEGRTDERTDGQAGGRTKDLINSESVDILFNIVQMIVYLLAVNHFLACSWYATSFIGAGNSWVKHHGFENEHWSYQYVTSFHWAITQFTPSSMHVQPQNIYERTFCVIVVISGLVGFSYLVGSITGSLAELRRMKEDAIKQLRVSTLSST